MEHRVHWLRVAYWVGAVLDTIAAVYLWILVMAGGYNPDFAWSALLMTGWTALLIWADRRPLARKGVLPLTSGLLLMRAAYALWVTVVGKAALPDTAITLVWSIAIGLFFAAIYHHTPAEPHLAGQTVPG
jgi:hypothetical protein